MGFNVLKAPLTVLIAAYYSTTLPFLPTTADCLEMRDSEQWDFPSVPHSIEIFGTLLTCID